MITGPDEVDAAWLTAALRESGAITASAVQSFTAEAIGTGQVGHNVRFALSYDQAEPGAPATVVAKFPSPDEISRSTGVAVGTYEKEARFYRHLAEHVDIAIPHCHRVELDEAAHLSTLLFEDCAPAVQGDQLTGCTPGEAGVVVDQMPGLHAPLWDHRSLNGIGWLQPPNDEGARSIAGFYGALWPGFVDRYGDRLSPELRRMGERFGAGLEGWAKGRQRGPLTVVHGDFRLDNILFGSAAGVRPVTVVDWQTVAIGVGTDDLSYFLGAGLVPEERRVVEHDLVRRYHEGLMARGVTDYSFDRCWEDYRRYAFSGLQMAVVASMIVRSDERGDAMFLAMAERHTMQALDLGSEEFLGGV